jgi:hypothetical protein
MAGVYKWEMEDKEFPITHIYKQVPMAMGTLGIIIGKE